MARTTCSVKIRCMGSYDMVVWCNWCRHDNCVDHREIREVQVHVMAWWHCNDGVMAWWRCNDGVMQSARINVAGLRSDPTLGYKTWCGFRAIIESLTAQHNTHPIFYCSPLLSSCPWSMLSNFALPEAMSSRFLGVWGLCAIIREIPLIQLPNGLVDNYMLLLTYFIDHF